MANDSPGFSKQPEQIQVLITDPSEDIEGWIHAGLKGVPHQICSVDAMDAAPDGLDPDLALIEENPGVDFPNRLVAFKERYPRCQIFLIGRTDSDLSPRQLGPSIVRHWFFRPIEADGIIRILQLAGRSISRAWRERHRHSRSLAGLDSLLGRHPRFLETIELARKAAESATTTVLVLGETGTGKGLLARAIHADSPRSYGPYVDINCAALPQNLLESELFGHVRGAFTSAYREKPGLLELADGGTAFLDEIGELDPALQVKILKFLDDGMIRRVQGTEAAHVDVRMIAATNRDLDREVREGRFRLDLFHRLGVLLLRLPSLRERGEDIPLLARHYLGELSRRLRGRTLDWTPEALEVLSGYAWPGNIRELINVTERIALLAGGNDPITVEDLPPGLASRTPVVKAGDAGSAPLICLPPEGLDFDTIERAILEEALKLTSGNVTRAASLLRMGRGSLRYRLERLEIQSRASGRRGRPMGRRRPQAA